MEIKYADKNYLEKAKKIWEKNFDDGEKIINFYFENIFEEENFLILEDKEKNIFSSLHENKTCISLKNKNFITNYIVGVATDIEYRGLGYMNKLLCASILNAKQKELPFIILKAVNPKIYRKYGFEYFSDIENYIFNIENLKDFKINKELSFKKIDLDTEKSKYNIFLQDIKKIYDFEMRNFDIYQKRDIKDIDNIIKESLNEDMQVLISYFNDSPTAYIIYSIENNSIYVREFIARESFSKKSLLALLYTYKEYAKNCRFTEPSYSMFNFLFENQLEIKKETENFMMARIIDLEKFLEILDLGEEDLAIYIVDDVIKENTAVYYLDNERNIEKYPYNYDMKISISDFTAFAMGYFSIDDLIKLNKLEVIFADKVEILRKIFPKKRNYLQIYF